MEYILINESKLKITLGGEELEARALESEKLDYADPDAKQLFCDILEQARQRLGFDTTGYRVLLQLYPIRDGGCELYVTRLSKLDELDGGEDARAEQVRHQKRDAQRKPKKQKHKRAYRFETLEDLCRVCQRLIECRILFESSAYRTDDGWYLTLSYEDDEQLTELLPISELSFISEYGYAEDARATSLYLGEYAKEICKENAVETLGRIG
jgi:negative regulator of genetic competence, sporulation and motility